ncbi:chemotaxis protein CheB [Neolewinella persica]|uniref:chemotaxis protein CheB n=1 Tax=Neolewinella persica TaxID=70998 RepID=UPI0003765D9C|nr:chemotaxis protein CheB [Neolewinella persica]
MLNDEKQAIIVIGASAGGMTPLLNLIENIPEDCRASIFVVQHMPSYAENNLDQILGYRSKLPVLNAKHDVTICPGTIYTAVPDHHLILEGGKMLVTKGPKENHWRPSVDALFRSAAYSYRQRVVGIILSGALNDGTSGLWNIKHFSGTSVIQSREDAVFDGMPVSAAMYNEIDYELPGDQIGQLIGSLSKQITSGKQSTIPVTAGRKNFVEFELGVAKGENALKKGVITYGKFSPLTCPECHGALTEYAEGKLKRFRCHTGHAHTADSLLVGINNNIEASTWEVMRGMEEGQLLLGHMADILETEGHAKIAGKYRDNANSLSRRSKIIKSTIMESQELELEN